MFLQKNNIELCEHHPPQGLSEARRVREVSGVLFVTNPPRGRPTGAAALILLENEEGGIHELNTRSFS